jgi:hypothetical protein
MMIRFALLIAFALPAPGVHAQPAKPAIPTLASIHAQQPLAGMKGHVQLLGGSRALKAIPEKGVEGVGLIRDSALRFGRIADPLNPQRQVLYTAIRNTDPQTYFHWRVEVVPEGAPLVKSGVTYWIAVEVLVPAARHKAGAGNILQVHNSTPGATAGGPFGLIYIPAGYATPKAGLAVVSTVSSQPIAKLPGHNQKTDYHWFSDNPGFLNSTAGAYPFDAWVKWVFRYRGDPFGNTGLLQAWMNGVQVVNATGITIGTAPMGFPTDYVKSGVDDWQKTAGGDGIWQMMRSLHVLEDKGYSVEQVMALLN